MTVASIDFETRSRADLRSCGITPYLSHGTTEVLCMAWAIDDEPVRVWTEGVGPFPKCVENAAEIHAHNASFERLVLKYQFNLDLPPKKFRCSASRATQSGLPRSLDKATATIGCAKKDDGGHKLMLRMTKPDRKGNWIEDDDSMRRLFEYCARDVEAERDLVSRLPSPPDWMQRGWALHEVMNDRGLPIDRELCEGAVKILDEAIEVAGRDVEEITGGLIKTGGQVQKIKQFVNERGVNVADLRAETIDAILPDVVDVDAATLLRLRKSVAAAAPKKFRKALDCLLPDDRIRDNYIFPGAHTGRAASYGLQVMNLRKAPELFGPWCGAVEDGDQTRMNQEWHEIMRLRDTIASGNLGDMLAAYPGVDPVTLLGQSVRMMVAAPEGKTFLFSDLSQIEVRIAHWLSGNRKVLDLFREGGDIYVDFASYFFKTHDVSKAQRQQAKPVVLGCNYGMSAARLQKYAETFGLVLSYPQAEKAVQAFRKKYSNIPRLWKALEKSAIQCVLDGKTRRVHLVRMGVDNSWFFMELPSGRRLWYFKPEIVEGDFGPALSFLNNRGVHERTWGGVLVENACQAIVADIMITAMIRTEESGLDLVIQQHDEVGIEAPQSSAQDAGKALVECMTVQPEWAVGLPIDAGVEAKKRWLK